MNEYDQHHIQQGEDQRQFNPNQFLGSFFQGMMPWNQPGGFPGPPWAGGSPGGGFPGQPGGGFTGGPPSSPPPGITPEQPQFQALAVDPGAIRGCLYRFTFVWLRRSSFWFYPVFVGRESVAGYRWNGRRWVYFGIDLDRIQSFQCF